MVLALKSLQNNGVERRQVRRVIVLIDIYIYGTRQKHLGEDSPRIFAWIASGTDHIIGVKPMENCLSTPSVSVL